MLPTSREAYRRYGWIHKIINLINIADMHVARVMQNLYRRYYCIFGLRAPSRIADAHIMSRIGLVGEYIGLEGWHPELNG